MRKNLSIALATIALMSVLGAVACSTTEPPDEQINDAAIVAKIKTELAANTEVAATNIDVDCQNGVVTLTGTVRSENARREAERIARNTGGVTRVISRIRVG